MSDHVSPRTRYCAIAHALRDQVLLGQHVKLDANDREGMLLELRSVGDHSGKDRGDAFVVTRYYHTFAARVDADWNEEDHPRGEHGKFGSGGGGAKPLEFEGGHAEASHGSYQVYHSNPGVKVQYTPKGGESTHLSGPNDFTGATKGEGRWQTPGDALKAAEDHHQSRALLESKGLGQGSPAMAKGASMYANEMSKGAKAVNTPSAHQAAASAHLNAAEKQSEAGNQKAADQHLAKATEHTAAANAHPMSQANRSAEAHQAAANAYAATARAENSGRASDHDKAALEHSRASEAFAKAGDQASADKHEQLSEGHSKTAFAGTTATISETMHAGRGQSTPINTAAAMSGRDPNANPHVNSFSRPGLEKQLAEARTKGAEAQTATANREPKAAAAAHLAAASAYKQVVVSHSLHEGLEARGGEREGRVQANAHMASNKAELLSAKANQKSESSVTRAANHMAAAGAHEQAAVTHLNAGNVAQSDNHMARANEEKSAAARAESRPGRQADFIKSEIESKVPGAKVEVSQVGSLGHNVTISHGPSGSEHSMGVSKYGITPGSSSHGSAYTQHPTNGTTVSSGRDKFEKVMKSTLNKAKKLDELDFDDE